MSVQYIRTPGGDELAVLPRADYEDLADAVAGQRAAEALARGEEELLSAEEMRALLAAPTPLAFWRAKRGIAVDDLARRLDITPNHLESAERGEQPLTLSAYRNAATALAISLDDLAAD